MLYDPDGLGISSDNEISLHHCWLVQKIQGPPNVKWDVVAMILTIMVILFTPDFIQLDDNKEAQRVQLAYASLLYRYFQTFLYTGCFSMDFA